MVVATAKRIKIETDKARRIYRAVRRMERIIKRYDQPLTTASRELSRCITDFNNLFRFMRSLAIQTTKTNINGAKESLKVIKSKMKNTEEAILDEEARSEKDRVRIAAIEKIDVDLINMEDSFLKESLTRQITLFNSLLGHREGTGYNQLREDLETMYNDCARIIEFVNKELSRISAVDAVFKARAGKPINVQKGITNIATRQYLGVTERTDIQQEDVIAKRNEIKSVKDAYHALTDALHRDKKAIDCIHGIKELLGGIEVTLEKEFAILKQEEERAKAV